MTHTRGPILELFAFRSGILLATLDDGILDLIRQDCQRWFLSGYAVEMHSEVPVEVDVGLGDEGFS
jgi:hypothetical protein